MELVIRVKIEDHKREIPEQLGHAVFCLLRDYEDGRYPFEVEMFNRSLQDCVDIAARKLEWQRLNTLYGGEVILVENCIYNRADKEIRDWKCSIVAESEPIVTLE